VTRLCRCLPHIFAVLLLHLYNISPQTLNFSVARVVFRLRLLFRKTARGTPCIADRRTRVQVCVRGLVQPIKFLVKECKLGIQALNFCSALMVRIVIARIIFGTAHPYPLSSVSTANQAGKPSDWR
jgi:hypothetical protein